MPRKWWSEPYLVGGWPAGHPASHPPKSGWPNPPIGLARPPDRAEPPPQSGWPTPPNGLAAGLARPEIGLSQAATRAGPRGLPAGRAARPPRPAPGRRDWAAATADSGALSLSIEAILGRVKDGLFRTGGALDGRRCSTDPNEQAPTLVHASSLYRATRRGWGPHGQQASCLLQAHYPGCSRPLLRPKRHGCHLTSESTPTTEVAVRAQIARARLGLVTTRRLDVPPEPTKGGSFWPGRALERQCMTRAVPVAWAHA